MQLRSRPNPIDSTFQYYAYILVDEHPCICRCFFFLAGSGDGGGGGGGGDGGISVANWLSDYHFV